MLRDALSDSGIVNFEDLARYLRQVIDQNRDIIRLLNIIAKIPDASSPVTRRSANEMTWF